MVFDPQKAKAENDRINSELKKEPEYAQILDAVSFISYAHKQIESLKEAQRELQSDIETNKQFVKGALEALEEKTGFSKAPGLAHLMTVAENYSVKDVNAVPPDYIVQKITSSVDKKKLNAAIKSGEVDIKSNWLEVIPGYKTVVIE